MKPVRPSSRAAVSLIELLCVMAIIDILAGLLLGSVGRAYKRAKQFGQEMNEPAHVDELRTKVIAYAQAHPVFPRLSLDDLVRVTAINSRCERWLRSPEVEYMSFASSDPDEKVVLAVTRGEGTKRFAQFYPKGWLCKPDPE